jgi:hypothetical protein
MKRRLVALLIATACLLVPTAPAFAQSVIVGRAGNGFYKIAVPDTWNGDLVVWSHGYSLSPIVPFEIDPANPLEGLGPLAGLQMAEGYAVAASSFRMPGWAVFKTKNDLQALARVFERRVGVPARIFLTGGSLGGLVTINAIETASLGNVVGGLSLCGPLAGSRNWDGAVDLRLAYDAICALVPGAFLPGGASGLPPGSSITPTQVALAVDACTGILTPPGSRTRPQQDRLSRLLRLVQIPESFLLTTMGFATFGLADLVHDPKKLDGRIGAGNANVDYGDPVINAIIPRVTPDRRAARELARNYTPTGLVGSARIVSLHTDKDGLVIVENESEYATVVPPSSFTSAVVVEAQPTHCGFTPAETVAAWEALRAWVAGAPQPNTASIQAACTAIAPTVGGPCRIDPSFVVPDMDGRIRPR